MRASDRTISPIRNRVGFDAFWASYPRKVGRLAAIREWNKLHADEALVMAILAGVAQYKQQKPGYADWCHPKTWIAQGRWMDEADEVVIPVARGSLCAHQPPCRTITACVAKTLAEAKAGHV